MRIKQLSVIFSVLTTLTAVAGGAQPFKIDPAWSHIEFEVGNMAVNTVHGRFKSFVGSINLDETDVTKSSANVAIQMASVDTGIKKRDTHLQAPEFFDASRFPEMTFASTRIEKQGNDLVLVGPLTIKGHTKELALPFTYSLVKSEQGVPTLRAQAQVTINRHDFGIDYGSNFSVSKEVKIIIHIQAVP